VPRYRYQIALILAEFLRRRLIAEEKKLTFETVLAHPSKLDLILHAAAKGYLIYLYFIGTESPEINKYRVKSRVKQGGHFVPEYKVESRYFKSMDLLHEAAQISYRVYFIDNSAHGQANMFAHFKVIDEKKIWDPVDWEKVPQWFYRYYVDKVKLQVASRQ
jgi:predicted ABC-type ATPase